MSRMTIVMLTGLTLTLLVGCGGGNDVGGGSVVPPPADGGGAGAVQVGPLAIRTASAAGFMVEEIPNPSGPVSLAALHGSRITRMASQAYLDRIVFSRGIGIDYDICVCNLDGSHAVRLIDNDAYDQHPEWSPDGQSIAFQRTRPPYDAEIVVMDADGSSPHALTNNSDEDDVPTWAPDGLRLAFQTDRTGDNEIYVMYADGTGQVNLTSNAGDDGWPSWSPDPDDPAIYFSSDRDDPSPELYMMLEDGSAPTRLTTNTRYDVEPDFDPNSGRLAWNSCLPAGWEVMMGYPGSTSFQNLSADPATQASPSWSSDGRFVCYHSDIGPYDDELVLQEVAGPRSRFVITHNAVDDRFPHLGSPTLQTDRVIIGPNGSDWGGRDPIWSFSDAGIVAWADDGYRNFVRIGVSAAALPTLTVSPLASAAVVLGGAPLAVLVEASAIANLREDGGRGRDSVVWQFDPANPSAVVLYLSSETGKLLSALVLADQASPANADACWAAVTHRTEAGALVVDGSFAGVYNADGRRIARAASSVHIDADGGVTVLR